MDTPITRAEHEEFAKRMVSENQRLADENSRQNHRIDLLEENVRGMSVLRSWLQTWKAWLRSRSGKVSGWRTLKAAMERCGARLSATSQQPLSASFLGLSLGR